MLEMFTYCNYVLSVHLSVHLSCVSVFGKYLIQFGMRKQTHKRHFHLFAF